MSELPTVIFQAGAHSRRCGPLRRAGSVTASVLTLLGLLLAGAMLIPILLGYRVYVLDGGSMTPTIDRGALVYDRLVPVDRLRVGDIITYLPPPGTQAHPQLITHRIVWVGHLRGGRPVFETKGDHNRVADPWRFVLHSSRQAVVAFHIPDLGYVYALLSIRWVRMLVIGLPALVLAITILQREWRRQGEQLGLASAAQGSATGAAGAREERSG